MASPITLDKIASQATRWLTRQLQKRVPHSAANPFLAGPFAPVSRECTETTLHVQGEIPETLNGMLLRIGPNPLQVENPAVYNWFVGDGMVHGLRLQGGRARWYRNRFIGVDNVNKMLGRPIAPGPRRGPSDAVNTNIIGHAGQLWALVEAGAYPVQLDAELNTLKHGLFDSAANLPFSAHPHVDPDTGELHAICYDALARSKVHYLVIDKEGKLKRNVAIPVQHGPMMHDCAITASQVIILDLPVTFSLAGALKGSSLPYAWNPRHAARVGTLPRTGDAKDIRWFSVDPCFVFHTCNAYDLDNGNTVLDVVVHERTFASSIQGPAENQAISFERWTLDRASGQVQRRVISHESQDFPRLDERFTGKPYRYAYTVGISADPQQPTANQLFRHDLHTGETLTHHYGAGKVSGEAIFVPRHAGADEGDGWLMSYVHDLDGGPSQVVILDAQKLGEAPQAVIDLGVPVPLGFHGNWVGD